jgi:hypothetical protein
MIDRNRYDKSDIQFLQKKFSIFRGLSIPLIDPHFVFSGDLLLSMRH